MFDVRARPGDAEGRARYGVVIKRQPQGRRAATEKLRAEMRAERGPAKLFDRGFESIDELKGRCKAETGFDPPLEPRFMTTYKAAAE